MEDPTKPDPDENKPIYFTEAFRRARRNVLIWSTLATVASLSAKGDEPVRLGGYISGLALGQNTLVVGLLIILAVMIIGYIRADRGLRFLNNEDRVAARDQGLADLFDTLRNPIGQMAAQLSKVQDRLTATGQGLKETELMASETRSLMDGAKKELRTGINAILQKAREERQLSNGDREMLGDTEQNLATTLGELHLAVTNLTDRQGKPAAEIAAELSTMRSEIRKVDDEIIKFEAKIGEFSSKIDQTDKDWFKWHDRRLVIGASFLAVLLCTWRLGDGQSMDTALEWLNEPAVVSGQFPAS